MQRWKSLDEDNICPALDATEGVTSSYPFCEDLRDYWESTDPNDPDRKLHYRHSRGSSRSRY